ncbi:hypothetical protein [Ruegeria sp. HKCCA5763]|uniref:hypothetical protein n=1 Tax=Ruegeria sp. HKCCA5763 TaxID=2682987 RepID=UPI001487911A|nr:hypothetical protein [Ruegeria sp. HKCCA5763]
MRKYLLGTVLATSMGFVLTGCTQGPINSETGEIFNVQSIPDLKFVAGGSNGNRNDPPKKIADLDEQEFVNVLHVLAPDQCERNGSLNACIQRLKNDTKKFGSLSGITGQSLVRVAEAGRKANGKTEVFVKGQILEKCAHDPALQGYHYENGNLRLCVLMVTEIPKAKNKNNKFRYQYFHVEASSARVEKRNNNDPNNIFPAAANATGLKIKDSPDNQNLNYKLYANGRNIRVVNYWEANAKSKNSNPAWKMYTSATAGMPPRIAAYFKVDPDACVDMLFPTTPPPTLQPGAAAGVHYCLGRCKNPPIVNTK